MTETVFHGDFYKSLTKNFSQIKKERAESVTEDLETVYRYYIESLCKRLKDVRRAYNDILLEIIPETSFKNTAVLSSFDPQKFLQDEEKLGIDEHNLMIKLDINLKHYEQHFGTFPEMQKVLAVYPEWANKSTSEASNSDSDEEEA